MSTTKKILALLIALMVLIPIAPGSVEPALAANSYWSFAKVTAVTDTSVTVSWQHFPDAEQYQIYYSRKGCAEKCIVIKNEWTTSYTIDNLIKGCVYDIRVDCVVTKTKYHYYGNGFTSVPITQQPVVKKIQYYVIYMKGTTAITVDCNETTLPVGTPVANLGIDLYKYAPSSELYVVPGELQGDTVLKECGTIVIVQYKQKLQ